MIMFQAIRQTGGSWAGAGIALGAAILVSWLLGIAWPVAPEVMQALAIAGLVAGVVAYLLHSHGQTHPPRALLNNTPESAGWREDIKDVRQNHQVSDRLWRGLRTARHQSDDLDTHPDHAAQVVAQIRAMLPPCGC